MNIASTLHHMMTYSTSFHKKVVSPIKYFSGYWWWSRLEWEEGRDEWTRYFTPKHWLMMDARVSGLVLLVQMDLFVLRPHHHSLPSLTVLRFLSSTLAEGKQNMLLKMRMRIVTSLIINTSRKTIWNNFLWKWKRTIYFVFSVLDSPVYVVEQQL